MDGLKQRVIGAVVLVSLAVIFVPMLFDEPHTERSSRVIDIPEEPPFPEVEAPPVLDEDAPSYRLEEPSANPVFEQPTPDSELAPAEREAMDSPQPSVSIPDSEPEPPETPAPQPSPSEPSSEPAQETESEEFTRSLEGAWVVQLGSFGNADNARRLRDNVREKGYDSHTQRIERGDTTFTRVFSGPYSEKSDAEKAKKALDAEFGVNGLVTSGN
ncbi:MAG: SPOR domain-containing protein [Marinobacter sp.]|uniref:SPOR domain-containing protein n=1 Tax=Marinobacter sp. TaxID=50741 RepID=UPI0034A00252